MNVATDKYSRTCVRQTPKLSNTAEGAIWCISSTPEGFAVALLMHPRKHLRPPSHNYRQNTTRKIYHQKFAFFNTYEK